MFICVVDECDVRVYTIILVFHHDACIEVMHLIIRPDSENTIRDGHGFRIQNGRVTTESEVTQELSLGGAHDVSTPGCEVNG